MAVVTSLDSYRKQIEIEKEISKEPTEEYIEQWLLNAGIGEKVQIDNQFHDRYGNTRTGWFLDSTLKANVDQYLIKAVKKKWDGVILITGMEGSGKSTATMAIAKYCDPTFPGRPIDNTLSKRTCDRIVFTPNDLMTAIDNSKIGQAIVFDEAVMGFLASDASSEMQKILIKKMVTIRKKRLYIFIVIPSIFLLRKYMAVFRSRALIHYFSPDGLSRGSFKFYGYDTKRELYFRGLKEFNQGASKYDFIGHCTNTEGYFFNQEEYETKKDMAIRSLTQTKGTKTKKTEEKYMNQRNGLWCILNPLLEQLGYTRTKDKVKYIQEKGGNGMKFSAGMLTAMKSAGLKYISENFDKQEIKDLDDIVEIREALKNDPRYRGIPVKTID